ncbi:MAG: DUF1700 domain-containing protein [Actinobacteria bacterium]|nr:DUF1700 domain-containing protein [Actinomycetota bacterium]
MNKKEFLNGLSKYLRGIPREDEQDIISDFEEHFEMGMKEGRTEEELAESLGDPKALANQLRASIMVARAEKETTAVNITRAVFASLGLGFFNLIFILGPFVGFVGVLVGLFASAIGITAGGITGLLATIFSPVFPEYFNMIINPAVGVFASIGLICFGVIFFIGDIYLTRGFFRLFIRYIKFNARIVIGKEKRDEV